MYTASQRYTHNWLGFQALVNLQSNKAAVILFDSPHNSDLVKWPDYWIIATDLGSVNQSQKSKFNTDGSRDKITKALTK